MWPGPAEVAAGGVKPRQKKNRQKETINMPRGNRTGPEGQGPKTGRGAGYCTGNEAPGYANPTGRMGMGRGQGMRGGRGQGMGAGRGAGQGRGGGFGRGYFPGTIPVYQEPSPEEEKTYLENHIKAMEQELADMKARIMELTEK